MPEIVEPNIIEEVHNNTISSNTPEEVLSNDDLVKAQKINEEKLEMMARKINGAPDSPFMESMPMV